MMMPGRSYTSGSSNYRYGFNGKELDKEAPVQYDYGFRIYDPRLVRFKSDDPLTKSYPGYTPYQFAGNKPIIAIDLDGLEEKIVIVSSLSETKPVTQTQSAISLADEMAAHQNAINGIMNRLNIEELKNPKEPPSVLEWGTMGELTVNEKREIIENTVREFTICIGTSTNTTPNFNPNVVTDSYTATYDFNYTLLGSKEKIDDIKSSVKTATTVIEYASKVREITGKLPKVLDKISGPSSILSSTLEGDGLGVATEVCKILVEKGLTEFAKKATSLAPVIGFAKSNPVTLTIKFTFMNSAPTNNNDEIKVKRTEQLKMKTIGALLYLFENNNKQYKIEGKNSSPSSTNASDHPEDTQWKQNIKPPQ
jgi:RHS repeat-associated protein